MRKYIFSCLVVCVGIFSFTLNDRVGAEGNILQFRGVFGASNYNVVNNVYYTARIGLLTAWGDAGEIVESNLRCLSTDYEEEGDTSGQLDISIYSVSRDRFLCKFIPSDNIKLGDIGIGLYTLLVYDVTKPERNDNFYIHYDSNPDFLIADHVEVIGDGSGGYIIDFNNITDTSAAPFTIEHVLHHAPFDFVGYFLESDGDVCPVDEIDYIPFHDNPLVISDLNSNHQQVCWFVRDLALNEKIEGVSITVTDLVIPPDPVDPVDPVLPTVPGTCEEKNPTDWLSSCVSYENSFSKTDFEENSIEIGKNIGTFLYYINTLLIIGVILISILLFITAVLKR